MATYGPNRDTPNFYTRLINKINASNEEEIIFCGDFNIVNNHEIDQIGYNNQRNTRAKTILNGYIETKKLFDPVDHFELNRPHCTWYQTGGNRRSKLDSYFLSQNLRGYLKAYKKYPLFESDHTPIRITLDFSKFRPGKGNWKLPKVLLHDEAFIYGCKREIKKVVSQYTKNPENDTVYFLCDDLTYYTFLDKLNLETAWENDFTVDMASVFDSIILAIRAYAIAYQRQVLTDDTKKLKDLHESYENASQKYELNPTNEYLKQETENRLNEYKQELKLQQQKSLYRSKFIEKLHGERSNKTLCNLEKAKASQRYIGILTKTLTQRRTVTLKTQKEVDEEIYKYYKSLFANDNLPNDGQIETFLDIENIPKLTTAESNSIEGEFTENELKEVLRRTKNESAPGPSGIPFTFYKLFWEDLKGLLVKLANECYITKRLPISQQHGTLTLIPKGDKSRLILNNWRPLTLLSCVYKLFSGVIAARLNKMLPKIISNSQFGFVKGRYIGEAIRTTYDAMEYARNQKRAQILLLIDFKKAFDSLSHNFLIECLKKFGFGENIRTWIEILIKNFKININNGGNLSDYITLFKGCKQGDPISSCLFILGIEILSLRLKNDPEIKGMTIGIRTLLQVLFADDMTIFLEYDKKSLMKTLKVLQEFYNISGLKIQVDKTQATIIGVEHFLPPWSNEFDIIWKDNFKLLGIQFDNLLKDMDRNIDNKLNAMTETMRKWEYKILTPIGRLNIAKTFITSKISHIGFTIPIAPKIQKEIEQKVCGFIMNDTPYCDRTDSKANVEKGGMKMIDVESQLKSFSVSWIRRLYLNYNSDKEWVYLFKEKLRKIELKKNERVNPSTFWTLGTKTLTTIAKLIKSDFWKKVITNAIDYIKIVEVESINMLINENLWDSHVFYENKSSPPVGQYNSLSKRITKLSDLIIMENNICPKWMTLMQATRRYGNIQRVQFNRLIEKGKDILKKYKFHLRDIEGIFPMMPALVQVATNQMKGCNKWGKKFRQKFNTRDKLKTNLLRIETKHNEELNLQISTSEFQKIYRNRKTLNFDNKLSFFQFLINRNNTYTNQKLATFKEWISPLCTFCKQQEENINHLFWNCPITSNFITQCIRFLYFKYEGFNQINRKLNKENFIFGIKNESYTTIDNLVLMMIKKFIWNKRCKEEIPTINQFKSYLKTELTHYMNVNLTPKPDVRLKIMDSKPFQDFINQL